MSKRNMTNQEYKQYSDSMTPNSRLGRNLFLAFIIGGFICVLGQLIQDFFKSRGMEAVMASGAASIILILLSALATGLNLYDKLAKHAGAGTLVPITGFANAIVAPAMEYKSEGHVLGIGAKMFIVAGPVLVYGIIASAAAGLLYYFFAL